MSKMTFMYGKHLAHSKCAFPPSPSAFAFKMFGSTRQELLSLDYELELREPFFSSVQQTPKTQGVGTNSSCLHLGKGRKKGKGRDQDATRSLRPGRPGSLFQVIQVGT